MDKVRDSGGGDPIRSWSFSPGPRLLGCFTSVRRRSVHASEEMRLFEVIDERNSFRYICIITIIKLDKI